MTRDFLERAGLNHKITIYVPSTKNVGQKIPAREFHSRIVKWEKFLGQDFGGATRVNAVGTYISENKGLIGEKVAKVEAFTKKKLLKQHLKEIEREVYKDVVEWGQESISVERDNVLHFANRDEALKKTAQRLI